MQEKILYPIWGCLYILCVGLGFIQDAQGFGRVILVLIALAFFVPGILLAYKGLKEQKKKLLVQLRVISILSLSLTLAALTGNFLSANASTDIGNLMYELLALVSAPMLCGQYWVMSLFLWACLLMTTFLHNDKAKA